MVAHSHLTHYQGSSNIKFVHGVSFIDLFNASILRPFIGCPVVTCLAFVAQPFCPRL